MDASSLTTDGPLPDDAPTLQALLRQGSPNWPGCVAENAELKAKLDQALKHRFGRRSDAAGPGRASTRNGPCAGVTNTRARSCRTPAATRGGPRPDRGGEALPLLRPAARLHRRAGGRTARPGAGALLRATDRQEDLRLSALRPGRGPGRAAATDRRPAQVGPIPKGLCGPGLLAHVITAKFADHTPLHRLATQLARSGVAVARTTLGDWLRQAADLLEPLYLLMHRRLLLSRVIHGDDTSVELRMEGSERTAKAHLWVGIGDADFPYVVFDFTAGYTAAGPERFFSDYRGYLQADALAQYEGLYGDGRVQHVCCWATPAASSWRRRRARTSGPRSRWG